MQLNTATDKLSQFNSQVEKSLATEQEQINRLEGIVDQKTAENSQSRSDIDERREAIDESLKKFAELRQQLDS